MRVRCGHWTGRNSPGPGDPYPPGSALHLYLLDEEGKKVSHKRPCTFKTPVISIRGELAEPRCMSRKPCVSCGKLIPLGQARCAQCELRKRQRYEASRGNAGQRGYGAQWRRLCREMLQVEPYCECGERADTVDHIVPRLRGGRDHPSNLETMCRACHSRKTAKQDGGFGNE